MTKGRRIGFLIVCIGLLVTSIAVLILGFDIKSKNEKFKKETGKVLALVQNIETDEWGEVEKVIVAYQVGDEVYYDVELDYEPKNAVEGYGINIYYDKNNSSKIVQKEYSDSAGIVLIILAIVFGGVSIFLFCFGLDISLLILKHNNTEYLAEVIDIYKDELRRVNGIHPFYVECKVYNSVLGKTILFRSKAVLKDLSNINLRNVKVYVNEKNMKKYFVDVEGTLKEMGW